MPEERLSSLHLTIEYAVSQSLQKFKNLQDKDIEWVYEQYRNYFQALRQGKVVAEPDSTRRDRSALMDFIWECLVKWEAADGPEGLLDGSFRPSGRPVTQVEELYVMAFNDLRKSCRRHRQQGGPRGYIKYAQQWVEEILASNPDLEDLLDPTVPADEGLDPGYLLEKRNYRITLDDTSSGNATVDAWIYEDESEEDHDVREYEAMLKRHPDNQLLRAEYAVALKGEEREEEAIAVWQKLIAEASDHPYYLSAYLSLLLDFDDDFGFEEAERLNFQFELDKYPFDAADGYSVTALLAHSYACIKMALFGKDFPYVLELFDDLLRAGLPNELLLGISGEIILHGTIGKTDDELEDGLPLEAYFQDRPELTFAREFLEAQWATLVEAMNQLRNSRDYPNADPSRPPWPRDPDDVAEALQLRINIRGSAPEIFRTIVVPDDTLLPDLHDMLQVAFDWEEAHLHEFIQGDIHYGAAAGELGEMQTDYHSVRIGDLLKKIGDELTYLYDFGDHWEHRIVLEALPAVDFETLYPRCIAGARRGPKEDSGGIHGYQEMLKILEDPKHPEYGEYREWIGEGFDPGAFVLGWTHRQLWKGRFGGKIG